MIDINCYKPYRKGKHATFTAEENRCSYIGENPKRKDIRQFKIDGEVFSKGSSQLRCDFLFLNDTDQKAYYVELKGSNILHAIEQIKKTEEAIQMSIIKYAVYRRIVCSRSCSHDIRNHKCLMWRKSGKGANIIKERQMIDTY